MIALVGAAGLFLAAFPASSQRNLAVAPTIDEVRVALVVGNGAYKDSPLANPVNDAGDVANALESVGFKVVLKRNAGTRDMRRAIREFGLELRRAQVGLFYFAGHGVQVKGSNYLVPVGADIESEADAEDLAIDANYVLRTMEEAQVKVSIVILDACRNNPFARSFRSTARGLAQMNAATGSVIAFATAPGSVAADGAGRNGTYTRHLLASLNQPDTDVLKVFQRTRAAVVKETSGKQTPWESTSLVGDFYFRPPATPAAAPALDPAALELALWDSVRDSRNPEELKAYLEQYPNGRFAGVARARLKTLQPAAPATTPTPVAIAPTLPVPAVAPVPGAQNAKPAPEISFARCDINGRLRFKDGATGCLENHSTLMALTGGNLRQPNFNLALSGNPASCPSVSTWTWGNVGMTVQRCNEKLEAQVGTAAPQCKCEHFEQIASRLTKSEFVEFEKLFAMRQRIGWTPKDPANPISVRDGSEKPRASNEQREMKGQ